MHSADRPHKSLDGDVAVVGLGAMGSAALWRLASRRADVVGFERFEPGHDRGSSHGESKVIRPAYYGEPYVELLEAVVPLWKQLERETSANLLTVTGGLLITHAGSGLFASMLEHARQRNLEHEVLDAVRLRRRYPQHRIEDTDVAIYEVSAGLIRPEVCVRAAVARAVQMGARVKTNCRVEAIEDTGEGVRIRTSDGWLRFRHAVISAGSWLAQLVPGLPVPLQIERQVLAWFRPNDVAMFSMERFPVFVCEIAPGQTRYGFPTLDGQTIKLAVHHEGSITSSDTIDRDVSESDVRPIEDFVRQALPDVEPHAIRTQVCMYTNTPGERFLIGSPVGRPAVTILGVCSGHGFKFAPVAGEIAADLALDGRTRFDLSAFVVS